MERRKFLSAGAFIVGGVACSGCGNGELAQQFDQGQSTLVGSSSTSLSTSVNLLVKADASTTLMDQGGKQLSEDDFQALLNQVEVQQTSFSMEMTTDEVTDFRARGEQFGNYYARIDWHKHRIGACINRDVWHLNLELKKNKPKPEVIIGNLHLVMWLEGGGPQFGVYLQRSGGADFCRTTRGTLTSIREALKDAFSRVVPNNVANALAYWVALVVVGAFALAFA